MSLLVFFFTLATIGTCSSLEVTLYSSTSESGFSETLFEVNGCVDLDQYKLKRCFDPLRCPLWCCSPVPAADNVESVNTHGKCIRVYRNYNCKDMVGPRIEPGSGCHSDFGDCGFKNDIRSISPCDGQCIDPANVIEKRDGRCEKHRMQDGRPIHVTFDMVDNVKVPAFLETSLYRTHTATRTEFQGSYWTRRFALMQGRRGTDARGHLLASSLGGMAEDWNFAPQRTEINNGDGTGQGWKSLELKIKSHLQKNECTFVYWQQAIEYARMNPRPETFTIEAHFYETWYRTLVDVERVILQCYNNIENPPDGYCTTQSEFFPNGRP